VRVCAKDFVFLQFKNRIILISKSEIKLITSLRQKKYRLQYGLFVAEGVKIIQDFLDSGVFPHSIYTVETLRSVFPEAEVVSENELKKISNLKVPSGCLAVFKIPTLQEPPVKGLVVALDGVRDPGNLGTIIRLCDWFGVLFLFCSEDTVDCYNPKVVQASMGSIARVKVQYGVLQTYLKSAPLPAFAAVMEGSSVYTEVMPAEAILVLGNEANGISEAIKNFCKNTISIPAFGKSKTAESLNVAMATAILLSEFRRATEM